ncbi:MAG: protein NO VEIN domain-containing protein [Capsulimonadaceae bacterium]
MRFVTKDMKRRGTDGIILSCVDASLEAFFPDTWCSSHLLHPDYLKPFVSCNAADWHTWITSGRAGLHSFAPIVERRSDNIYGRSKAVAELSRRGYKGTPNYRYSSYTFVIDDWDFDAALWEYWLSRANCNDDIIGRVVDRILAEPKTFWSRAGAARMLQVSQKGREESITDVPILPSWVVQLRDSPCLRDTHGDYRCPADLLRRTPETETFIDTEPFVNGNLDTEANRPLLKLLGVRDTPPCPTRMLDYLRALAKADSSPGNEIQKWCRYLDRVASTCPPADLQTIKSAFRQERIIPTEGGGWADWDSVYVYPNEEEVPGALVVLAAVRDLPLWRKVEVVERPIAEFTFEWLMQLPTGTTLSPREIRGVKTCAKREAKRIAVDCSHWVNLSGCWVPTESLRYSLSKRTQIPYDHLHDAVRQKVADFCDLPEEITAIWSFGSLPSLVGCIDERPLVSSLMAIRIERKPWLNQIGTDLCRIELDDDAENARVRALAARLAGTDWRTVPGLKTVPYIDGQVAGSPRPADVEWIGDTLHVDNLPKTKLARLVPDNLGRAFGNGKITAALNHCYDRSPEYVTEYLEENFKLALRDGVTLPVDESDASLDPIQIPDPGKSDDNIVTPQDAVDLLLGGELKPTPAVPDPSGPEPHGTGGGTGDHRQGGDTGRNGADAGNSSASHAGGTRGGHGVGDTRPGGTETVPTHGRPAGRAAGPGGSRSFYSYVGVRLDDEDEHDPDSLTCDERLALDQKATERVTAMEPTLQRTRHDNPGFDLFEPGPDGNPVKWVEVKAMSCTMRDRPATMSKRQFECAREHGEAFWLYVVEAAGSLENARVVKIRDPHGKARTFTFDHGWLSVANVDEVTASDEAEPQEVEE